MICLGFDPRNNLIEKENNSADAINDESPKSCISDSEIFAPSLPMKFVGVRFDCVKKDGSEWLYENRASSVTKARKRKIIPHTSCPTP